MDFTACTSFHHGFSLLLDSGLRINAHVLRYLPIHPGVKNRLDVARRAERAMIIITRALGGERFYSSLLKCLQAISMQEMTAGFNDDEGGENGNGTNGANGNGNNKYDLVTPFLHSVYKRHQLLKATCQAAMQQGTMTILPEELKTLSLHGKEIYAQIIPDKYGEARRLFMQRDLVSLKLPLSLQPGYDWNEFAYDCEHLDSPILPLLRCLGPGKSIRVLSAVLCEVRIIFISKHVDTISACMRATMAMISQGLLVWRHVSIPVLPPHLFRFLSAGAPYIVGVLDRFADRIDRVKGLKDVLSIDLDSGKLKTYNMPESSKIVPDILESSKSNKKQRDFIGTEMLAQDFADVLEMDRKIWGKKEEATGVAEAPEPTKIANEIVANAKKGNSFSTMGLRESITQEIRESTRNLDTEESGNQFFDAAAVFVGTIYGSAIPEEKGEEGQKNKLFAKADDLGKQRELPTKPITKRPFTACENEQGEELLRASLICFFLELFGDLGLYLLVSKSTGALKVDKKKFLVRKCQLGIPEKSALWYALKQFSRSVMFERFVQCCILEAEQSKKKRTNILVDHVPLFSLCQKHLRKSKSNFSTASVRRVVYTTIEGCPQHLIVDKLDKIRELALNLTAEKPFEGNEVKEIRKLMQDCKSCNLSFAQVMAVIWMRVGEQKPNHWKHNLLGLHLLRNLVLHGPIMAVSSAMDGIPEIFLLQFHQSKIEEASRGIQYAATQLFELLKDTPNMFARRRNALSLKVRSNKGSNETMLWSNYLVRRLPIDVSFRHIHVMFVPDEKTQPNINKSENIQKSRPVPRDSTSNGNYNDNYTKQMNGDSGLHQSTAFNNVHDQDSQNYLTRQPKLRDMEREFEEVQL